MLDLDAGKYALYVWPAFGISALVFVALIWTGLGFARKWRRKAEALAEQLAAVSQAPKS